MFAFFFPLRRVRVIFFALIGLSVAWCPATGQSSVPSLEKLAPDAWTGVNRVEVDPEVVGISNASEVAGFGYSPKGSQELLAGALLFRTSDLAPYEHNLKTCRLVSDGAVFTGWTTLAADGALFPAYTTQAANDEVGTTFVAWTLEDGRIVIDSRPLAGDYPPMPDAVDSVTIQLFAVNQSFLNLMLRASLSIWAGLGNVSFNNVSAPQLPLVMIRQASHFPNTLTLQVMNYSARPEPVTIIVERYLTTDQTATPVVVVQPTTVVSGPSTVQVPVQAFEGAIIYVEDSTSSGNRDQAYLGRAFQYFTDQATGGTSSVEFGTTGCSSGGTNSPGALLLAPGCASLRGQVQQYSGLYLPMGSYVGEVVPLVTDGIAGIEFYARSATPFRAEVETTDVVDGDYYGVNLPASPQWTKFDVPFTALSQRGFGASVPFVANNTLYLSLLVPPNVNPPYAAPQPFSMAVDSVALTPATAQPPPPSSGLPQTITFESLANQVMGTGPFTLSATASSGLAVSFVSTTATVCTSAGVTVTLVSAGTCTITASQAGNATYAAATPVTQSFSVLGEAQTITFGPLANQVLGTAPIALSATASSGLAVVFGSSSAAVCTVSGKMVTLVTVGSCSITATQPGNSTYAAATPVSQSFMVSAPLTTSFSLSATPSSLTISSIGGKQTATITANSSTGLTGIVSFTCAVAYSGPGNVDVLPTCSIPGSVTLSGAGNSGSTVLTITTPASLASLSPNRTISPTSKHPFAALACVFCGLLLARWPRAKGRYLSLLILALSMLCLGCGGVTPTSENGAGSYTVSVTGSGPSGTSSQTVIGLTVQ